VIERGHAVRSLRAEAGFTAMELLLATTLMLLVLGATLTTMDEFSRSTRATEDQNDAQQRARQGMTQISRELRNHAVANTAAPEGIALATPYDLIFETVGASRPAGTANSANVQRIRYCLDSVDGNGSRLWAQTQTWTTASAPGVPGAIGCPSVLWGGARLVAENVVNRAGGIDRPVFTYDSTVAAEVRRVGISLYVDTTIGRAPKETRLESGVYLRNANHAPVASFTAAVTGSGVVVLDATHSTDRENEKLVYSWKVDGAAIPPTSAAVDWPGLSSGTHTVELRVTDPGGLWGNTTRSVVIP
jgi:type II secretory pathway pseudopilin PulG